MRSVLLALLLSAACTAVQGQCVLPTGVYPAAAEKGCIILPRNPLLDSARSARAETAALCTVRDFERVRLQTGPGGEPIVRVTLHKESALPFAAATQQLVGRRAVIIVDGYLQSDPVIRAPVTGGGFDIGGPFTQAEAARLSRLMRSEMRSLEWDGPGPEAALRNAIRQFDDALTDADTVLLRDLLMSGFTFLHSNGMRQLRDDVIADLRSGKLRYDRIESLSDPEITINDHATTVVRTLAVSGQLSGQAFNIRLRAVEVWKPDVTTWKLQMRQSTKLP